MAFILKAKGLPFEMTSDNVLENQYDELNGLFLSLAKSTGSRLAVWAHIDHYAKTLKSNYEFSYEWIRLFTEKYMARFEGESIFENSFYLTFILKPGMNDSLEECIRELEEMQIIVTQTLASYECEVLSIYDHNGHQFSQFYEFIAYLYNGFWERVPVTSLPLFQVVQTSALHHGYKLLETRFPNGGNRYSAFFDLKDFPEPTTRGKFNPC
ncbi:hypothetical protein MRX58_12685 (plasmid) [Xylella fastidiosa subsp. pauca]|nr:hypothetical protein [Xylella fastidiosa]MDG5824370.1 hypothetical protein [Xylella fastidiosa subsp. pauca]